MERTGDAERPATTRIGPAGGPGRGFRAAAVLVALAIAVAVAKPWDWIDAPSPAPGREGAAIPAASPGGDSSPVAPSRPAGWTGAGERLACLSGGSWLAIVDAVDGSTTSRTWTRLVPVPATGPADPGIVRTHVYAAAVPRIGFCAPRAAGGGPGAQGAGEGAAEGGGQFRVRAWRLLSGSPAATELAPVVVSGGTFADGGALYGPPADIAQGTPPRGTRDPERAWAARDAARAEWSPGDAAAEEASWPPGTYVVRVDVPGADAAGAGPAWFAIELRGPWSGPAESVAP
jgi:hypothetical protein